MWKNLCWSSGPVDHTDVPRLETGLESAPRWGCNEVGNLVCYGPHSWHRRPPIEGSRAGAGSNNKLNTSEGERGRYRVVQDGQARVGWSYLYCHLGDGQCCPWGRVPDQFPGNMRAARRRSRSGASFLGRGYIHGGDMLSGLCGSLAAAPIRGAAATICLRFPVNHRWER